MGLSTMLNLVGGVITSLKNMKVNGKDDIPYKKWKMKNVPNNQPDYIDMYVHVRVCLELFSRME